MTNIWNIVKKELDKIFRNPKMVFTTFILSPLIIFVVYSLMGNVMEQENNKIMSEKNIIGVINVVEMNSENVETTSETMFYRSIKNYNEIYELSQTQNESFVKNNDPYNLEYLNVELVFYDQAVTKEEYQKQDSDISIKIKDTLNDESIHAWVYYDQKFDQLVILNDPLQIPEVQISYKESVNASVVAFTKIKSLIDIQESIATYELFGDVTVLSLNVSNLATESETSNKALAMLVPMLIIVFIFAGGMSAGADLIAGEKERGTISTLLMTPISRNEIVIGKIIAGIVITTVSAICSAIGMLLSVGTLMGVSGGMSLTFVQIVQLLVVVILLALLAISIFMLASTFASTIKEASLYIMPIYILAMIVSIMPMFSDHLPTAIYHYIIPIYNIALAIKGILIAELTVIQLVAIICSTLVYFVILVFLTSKLFRNEKVMFSK